eukprot:TRINITY_DN8802_c0_g1_i11.p1 TRINITY_DN8802_c0_g1~~TRINITY_DN8802_c0_g1_i11.p1  ORF type:complete len:323 (+),score=76.41 TRINITY_DN8802_c0_g1_i11:182-1150(+)
MCIRDRYQRRVRGGLWVVTMAFAVEFTSHESVGPHTGGPHGLSIEDLRTRQAAKARRQQLERDAIQQALHRRQITRMGKAERMALERALMSQSEPAVLETESMSQTSPPLGMTPWSCEAVIGNLAWEVPPEGCRCPITLDIFYDPATCSRSGQRYELSALAPWIAEHATEPLTRLPYDFSVPLKIDDRMRVQLAEWRGRRVVSLLERARGTSEAAVVCGLLQEAIDCDPRNMELHALLVDACEQDGLAEEAEAARENLRRQMCEAEERCAMEAMLAANQEHLHRVRLVAEQLRNRSPLQQPAPPLEHPPVPCSMIRKVDNTD